MKENEFQELKNLTHEKGKQSFQNGEGTSQADSLENN